MRYQCLTVAYAAATISLCVPTTANAQPAWHAESARSSWQVESATPTWRIESTANWRAPDTKSAALKWEMGYLALSAIDAVQTIECLKRGACQEVNPIFGKRPSTKTIVISKIGGGLAHFALFSYLNDRNPKLALRGAQVSFALQGTVVALNARVAF